MADLTVSISVDNFMQSADKAAMRTNMDLNNVPNVDATQRANHTGTQLASTISDFDTAVGASTDVTANTAARHDAVTLDAGDATQQSLSLTGQEITANQATTISDGVMSAEDKTKLDGVEAGAEANNISDANATDLTDAGESTLHYHASDRARANHTGTQTASTISDFDTEVADNTDVATNTTHRGLTNNPHSVTKSQVGLGNCDNTSDLSKPVSTATQTALDGKLDNPSFGYHTATLTPSTSGTITLNGIRETIRYRKAGSSVHVQGQLTLSSVSSPVGTYVSVSLPYAVATLTDASGTVGGSVTFFDSSASSYVSEPLICDNATSAFRIMRDASTFAANDVIYFSFNYETT